MPDLVTGFALLVGLTAMVLAMRRQRKLPAFENREMMLEKRVSDLEDELQRTKATVATLQQLLYEKQTQIERLQAQIRQLEGTQKTARRSRQSMVIAYTDQKMLEEDLAALRGVTAFRRDVIRHASRQDLRTLIDERRGQGQPVRYVHLAMHASEQGVAFADGLADGLWMSETLMGVEVLVIAGCTSMRTASLTGSVPIVVSMRDEVDSAAARIFSRAFWGDIADGIDPEDAFYAAIDRSPTGLAEMVELKKYYA